MPVISVANAADLLLALKAAQDGDVIQLEPGTYSAISIRGFKFNDVRIESRDPEQPAVLSELIVRASSGLTFQGLELVVDPKKTSHSFQILESKNIQLDGLHVHGTLNGSPADDYSGIMIRNSDGVTVRNSEFEQLWNALEHLDSKNLTITDNSFHDIRTDAIRGGGTSDVLIARNLFKDFYPAAGDHGDAIQFWTTNTTSSAKNFVVTQNVILRGDGQIVQGIFFRDQNDKLPYENITVTNNLVSGMMYNAIHIDGARGVVVSGNVVEAYSDMKSWIRLEKVDGATLSGNEAFQYLKIDSVNILEEGNVTRGYVSDKGVAALTKWIWDHGTVGLGVEGLLPPVELWAPPEQLPDHYFNPPGGQNYEFPVDWGYNLLKVEPGGDLGFDLMMAHGFSHGSGYGLL